MKKLNPLLGTDFDGNPIADVDDLVYGGLDDPRHLDRVPALAELLGDSAAPEADRLLSCVALTTWGEPAGYRAVMNAAKLAKRAPWYEVLIDRKFSVDSTFAQLAVAVGDSDEIASDKGTLALRTEAFRSLVQIADGEYFEDKLGEIIDADSLRAVLGDIEEAMQRGIHSLASGVPQRFDLATQLVDLAASVALIDGRTASKFVMDVLRVAPSQRAMVHAATLLQRSRDQEVQQLGEYMKSIGDERVRQMVAETRLDGTA